MSACGIIPFDEVAEFHGHVCPGLAIGYVMSRAGLEALSKERAEDEELVAIVENDACGTDAVQYLTGCTFGKGNLQFHDYGKQVYTFYHRATGRAVRVTPKERDGDREMSREERVHALLASPLADVVDVKVVEMVSPDRAKIRNSVTCAFCGERVMETRARIREGETSCIPCASGT